MKITKEKLVGNTILFVCIIVFIGIFNTLFGTENTVVGIAMITGALVLLQRDLTSSPGKNLLILLTVNILSGIFCYFAAVNLWIGIPLDFIALFAIGYFGSSNLKGSIVIPFGLQYLFMLFGPVHGKDFVLRLCALAFGAFFIMFLQIVANKGKFKKSLRPLIVGSLNELENLIKEDGNDCTKVFLKLDNLKKILLEKRRKGYYFSKEGKEVTNIIWFLEKIAIEISEKKAILNEDEEYKAYLLEAFNHVKEVLSSKEKVDLNIKAFDGKENTELKELHFLIVNLSKITEKLMTISDLKDYDYKESIPEYLSKSSLFKRNFKLNTLKVSYGVRLAIIGTIAIFIAEFFRFEEGKWMAFTIFSLIQPYAETSESRMRDRIEGTIIGLILVVVLFFLVKNTAARGLILLVAGYLNPFADRYKSMVVLVTISAIASTVLVGGNTGILAIDRIFFVVCGAALAFLGSKYIVPYRIENGNEEIIENYTGLESILSNEIEKGKARNGIKSLYLLPVFFEEKIKSVNGGERLTELSEFTYTQRLAINKLYGEYLMKKYS